VSSNRFDWQSVAPPRHAWTDTIIYETHVRGFTRHASSDVSHRGQYLGVIEKIPYLKSLGVTAVELLPVQAFDTGNVIRSTPGLHQYWGYNPIALFAPHPSYSSQVSLDAPLIEFKTMVRELHRAGIEVILDIVFNHTGEAGTDGPTYSFRGLDNDIYYMVSADGSEYLDYTGCGNTLNCNHPVVRSMILECLRHWVVDHHIDGFRFDLAAVLGRGGDGALLSNPPLLEAIAEDPILRDVKLIAEAWDAAGAFQVGRFGNERWGEWNCCFRDDVRRFWRGDPGFSGRLATRLCGSADLYQRNGATPLKSINFVTSHDGFTLSDLVSFATKHNEANGEGNRDGTHENFSWNHGVEGVTDDAHVASLRRRQVKNMLATLLLSRGVPMLLGGDEFGRSQRGNNNAYCQDNETSWYDWAYADKNADLIGFVRRLIELRRQHPALRADRFYSGQELTWFGPAGGAPDWHGAKNQLGCIVVSGSGRLALLFNAATEPCDFSLPPAPCGWRIAINTGAAPAADAPDAQSAEFNENQATVRLAPCSTLILTLGAVP
jgi:glycogen operon protein